MHKYEFFLIHNLGDEKSFFLSIQFYFVISTIWLNRQLNKITGKPGSASEIQEFQVNLNFYLKISDEIRKIFSEVNGSNYFTQQMTNSCFLLSDM